MKKLSLLTALLCVIGMTEAATHAVLPGGSIQAKIDIAVDGDIVAIFGGTYNEDVTINKAIRLVEVSGQQVTLTGNVTFTGVTNCPVFDGFTVGSSGRGITVINTTGLVFRNLDARSGSGITTSGTTNLKI
jgi:nitrous oxidase accessory protein NosD